MGVKQMSPPSNWMDKSYAQRKLALVSETANHWRQKSRLSGLVEVVSLCVIRCDKKRKKLFRQRKKGTN